MTFTNQTLRRWTGGKYSDPVFVGAGAEATVWRAESATGTSPVALKVFETASRRSFYQELRVATAVKNPHLLELVEFFQPDMQGMLVYKFCSGGSLRELLDQPHAIPLERIVRIGLHIADALAALHGKGFVHGDVKPENVLNRRRTRGDNWKLADLGVSVDQHTGARSWAGTPRYMAPEAREGRRLAASDVWSLGTVLDEMGARVAPDLDEAGREVLIDLKWLTHTATAAVPADRPTAAHCRTTLQELEADLRASRYVTRGTEGDNSIPSLPGEDLA